MKLKEPLKVAEKFLCILSKGPLRRRDMLKAILKLSPSMGTAESIFRELKDMGLIRKVSSGHFDPYEITELGERFLTGLEFLREVKSQDGIYV